MPTSPQAAAGIRIEPRLSVPCATGTRPAATAAPAPPDEPPAEREGFHGFRVTTSRPSGPTVRLGQRLASDAASSRRRQRPRPAAADHRVVGVRGDGRLPQGATPRTGTVSLTATGTPASGSRARSASSGEQGRLDERRLAPDRREGAELAVQHRRSRSRAARTASTGGAPARTAAAIPAAVPAPLIRPASPMAAGGERPVPARRSPGPPSIAGASREPAYHTDAVPARRLHDRARPVQLEREAPACRPPRGRRTVVA